MLKIAIVDDDDLICSQVEEFLSGLPKEYGIASEIDIYNTGEMFQKQITSETFYDAVFLDIEMGGISGLDVSRILRGTLGNEATQIIYISGKTEYAIDVFDFDPIHFLPKPLTRELVEKAFLKLLHRLNVKVESFAYKVGQQANKVPIKDIIFFESNKRKILIHYRNKTDSFYGSLDRIQKQLENCDFLSIHKSFLINPLHVRKFTYETVEMSDHSVLQIAQLKRKEIRRCLLKLGNSEGGGL